MQRAAVYVPGGRAPYPSTVVMGVVTARAAGVPRDRRLLAAGRMTAGSTRSCSAPAELAGASEVYRMGGAQAVAALAHGTETVRGGRRDRRARQPVRPGGQAAALGPGRDRLVRGPERPARDRRRRQRSGADRAGPARAGRARAGNAGASASSTSSALLEALHEPARGQRRTPARCYRLVEVPEQRVRARAGAGVRAGAPRADRPAGRRARRPRHPGRLRVRRARLGDRVRRLHRGLQPHPADRRRGPFRLGAVGRRTSGRSFTEVRITDGSRLARAAAPIARAEGFELHARSMEARIGDD